MGYHLEASLVDGQPSLKVWDIEQNRLCLNWHYGHSHKQAANTQPTPEKEIQELFRQLLLLTVRKELGNVRIFQLKE